MHISQWLVFVGKDVYNIFYLLDKPQTLQGVSQLPQGLPQPKSGEYTTMTTEESMSNVHKTADQLVIYA